MSYVISRRDRTLLHVGIVWLFVCACRQAAARQPCSAAAGTATPRRWARGSRGARCTASHLRGLAGRRGRRAGHGPADPVGPAVGPGGLLASLELELAGWGRAVGTCWSLLEPAGAHWKTPSANLSGSQSPLGCRPAQGSRPGEGLAVELSPPLQHTLQPCSSPAALEKFEAESTRRRVYPDQWSPEAGAGGEG